jgi:hypothetical protein
LEGLIKQLKTAARSREEAKSIQFGATNAFNHQLDLTWDHGKALADNCMTEFQGHTDWLQALGLHHLPTVAERRLADKLPSGP